MLTLALPRGRAPEVRVASSFAPLVEVRRTDASPTPRGPLDAVIALPCVPAFLFPAHVDLDDAVDAAVSARADTIRDEIDDNDAVGFPLPPWVRDLLRPGHLGTRSRRQLRDELRRRGADIVHQAEQADVDVAAWVGHVRGALAERPPAQVLAALHPSIRHRDSALHVQLGSGADATATVSSELVLVPTLRPTPSVTTPSDPTRAARVFVPVRNARRDPARTAQVLAGLLGDGRSRVLLAIAGRPGHNNAELRTATGLSAASVSDHVKVLIAAGLVDVRRDGTRTLHRPTPAGRALVNRAGRP